MSMEPPEVPLEESQETIEHHAHAALESWIMGVALTAAILAACAAVNALMSEHYAVKAMTEQIKSADDWGYYQAKGIKGAVLAAKTDMLRAFGKTVSPADREQAEKYQHEQKEIQASAEAHERASEVHMRHHEALAPGVTMFQLAIAIGAIAVLTRRKLFWHLAMVFGLVGVLFFANGVLLWFG